MRRSVIALSIGFASLLPHALATEFAADEFAAGVGSLRSYPAALAMRPADTRVDRFMSYSSSPRSAAWLEQYTLAQRIYRESLSLARTDDERIAAASGFASMLNALDRPPAAFGAGSPGAPRSLLDAVQAARAALAPSGEDKSRLMLDAKPARVTIEIAETRPGIAPPGQQGDAAFRNGPRLSPSVDYIRDDNLRIYDVLLKAAMSPQPGQAPLGIVDWDMTARYQALDNGSRRTEVPQIQSGVRIKASEHVKLFVSAGGAETGGWTYPVATTQLSYRPSDKWGAEISAEHDALRTMRALEDRFQYSTASLGADFKLFNTTFAATLFRQWFSDENEREGWLTRLTSPYFLPFGAGSPAVALQLYSRKFDSARNDVIGYFSPSRYLEERLNLLVTAQLSPIWTLRMIGGIGEQWIDGTASSTLNTDLKISGRLSRSARLDFSFRHGDSTTFYSPGVLNPQTSAGVAISFQL